MVHLPRKGIPLLVQMYMKIRPKLVILFNSFLLEFNTHTKMTWSKQEEVEMYYATVTLREIDICLSSQKSEKWRNIKSSWENE